MEVGQHVESHHMVDEALVQKFADLSGDHNPLHLNAQYAAKTRFGRPIAHGALLMSFVSALLGEKLPGPGAIYLSQTAKFKAPVYVGESVDVAIRVANVRTNGIVTLEHQAKVGDRVVLEGESVILYEPVDD